LEINFSKLKKKQKLGNLSSDFDFKIKKNLFIFKKIKNTFSKNFRKLE